jgi:hypothetical protein
MKQFQLRNHFDLTFFSICLFLFSFLLFYVTNLSLVEWSFITLQKLAKYKTN